MARKKKKESKASPGESGLREIMAHCQTVLRPEIPTGMAYRIPVRLEIVVTVSLQRPPGNCQRSNSIREQQGWVSPRVCGSVSRDEPHFWDFYVHIHPSNALAVFMGPGFMAVVSILKGRGFFSRSKLIVTSHRTVAGCLLPGNPVVSRFTFMAFSRIYLSLKSRVTVFLPWCFIWTSAATVI